LPINFESASQELASSTPTLEEVEREYIIRILHETSWRIEGLNGAAKRLGLHPSTLRTRMGKLGIQKDIRAFPRKRLRPESPSLTLVRPFVIQQGTGALFYREEFTCCRLGFCVLQLVLPVVGADGFKLRFRDLGDMKLLAAILVVVLTVVVFLIVRSDILSRKP
jgi:Bacterial regulatory protein, Fis family